jgi:sRNA-binding carbon storage regulator CsrA
MSRVVTRYAGQRFFIGEHIEVYVSKIRANQVRISVNAPGNYVRWPDKEQDLRDREQYQNQQLQKHQERIDQRVADYQAKRDDQTHENYREPLAAQRVAGVDD